MSKGPIVARVNEVVQGKDFFNVCVTSLANGKKSEIKFPETADISALIPDVIITYYLAENVSSSESFSPNKHTDDRPVLVFLSDDDGMPLKNALVLLEKGEETLKLQKMPQIVTALFEVSSYYRQRKVLVEKALDVLKLTQDVEAIDALFSMKVENLYTLLGEVLDPLPQTTLIPCGYELHSAVVEDIFIPVQIADCLLSSALCGVDINNPCKHDLRHILFLACIHGETKEKIDDFIARYERK